MKKKIAKMNGWLLFLTILYSVLGCIMIYSASSVLTVLKQGLPSNYYFIRQVIILVVSFIGSLIVTKIPIKSYRKISLLLMAALGASLIGLLAAGQITHGTKGWYDLGFFSLQPAEFAKSIIIIYLACSYEKIIKRKETNFIVYLLPFFLTLVICLLILKQPDLGSAIIVGGIAFLMFLAVPMTKKIRVKCNKVILGIGIIGVIGCIAFKDKIFTDYQISRFSFTAPCTSEKRTQRQGYQVCNGYIAIKNGGLFGLGFGNSIQKNLYLPEAHTDFIFPIIVEELGMITGILIICGYVVMIYQIIKIAAGAPSITMSLICYGTASYLTLHILTNLMGVLGLMPLTGVPLPFFSYGGSFALNAIVMISIVQKIAIESKNTKLRQRIANL
ncbi:MAG: FtsW/RodA/SpoVE family cell cycle protein [bacterium]|nr:FtsW/RodA/SpoVE family cell cycle protein [bacterium]